MFLVDTNFLGQLETIYPSDVFPTLWTQLEGRLFSPDIYFHQEVHAELKRWSQPRLSWYLQHVRCDQILEPDEEEFKALAEVNEWVANQRSPAYRTAAANKFLTVADSWLVASAYRHDATIVTNEKSAPLSVKNVKIPDVANQFGVSCIDTLGFLRALRISV